MKLLIALYFFILATIQFGLLAGIYHYYHSSNLVKPSLYWLNSLIVNIFGLLVFGGGILFVTNIVRPDFNFTVANALFYIAALLQFLFCRSLNSPATKKIKVLSILSVITFVLFFELLRLHGNFEIRTALMCVVAVIFYGMQLQQLRIKRKQIFSSQIRYLEYATAGEAFFALCRFAILFSSTYVMRNVEQIPQLLILFTIAQLVMNTLAYIAVGGYWSEKMALEKVRSELKNQEIKSLLAEREGLIANLLRANKTAATGALSASIAHELNQPLGASHLNIQFLKKKLSEGEFNPEMQHQILDALLADNQRAASIIKSLQSIFSDEKIGVEKVAVSELIDSVLQITKPEISAHKIQAILKIDSSHFININRGEIQQVLLNLINNAIESLKDSARIPKTLTVEVRDIACGIEIRITDNGKGIESSAQPHLFKLLGDSRKKGGMGLGLWLCKHIISRHGGTIEYGDAPSDGAQFIVFLPFIQS